MPEREGKDSAKDLSSLSGIITPPSVSAGYGGAGAYGGGGGMGMGGVVGGAGGGAFGFPAGVNPFMLPFDPDSPALVGEAKEQLLFPEKRKRGLGERMCYGTGISYLAGLTTGGAWGLLEGLRHKEAVSARLRLTTVLNAVTKRGPFLGNRMGVLALGYNMVLGGLAQVREEEDAINSAVAGAVTGLAFQSTSGPRGMVAGMVAGTLLGGLLGGYEEILAYFKK